MKIRECMSTDVLLASPDDTIQEAALMMAEIDAGALPVSEKDRLVGMITDRDIACFGEVLRTKICNRHAHRGGTMDQ